MARRNDDYEDDFSFDDDFNFDDGLDLDSEGGFKDSKKSRARKATNQLSGSFVSGVKDTLFSEHYQEKVLEKSLPKGYAQAYGDLRTLHREASSVRRDVSDEVSKQVNTFKREHNETLKKVSAKLPKRFSERMDSWADNFSREYVATSDAETEALQTEAMLTEMFGKAQQVINEQQTEAAIETKEETKRATNIAANSNDLLFGINAGIGKMVGYQDNISIKYQRKMVELNYKQLLVSRKTLDVTQQTLGLQKETYEKLLHNTSLPDVVKIQNLDRAGADFRERLVGKITDPLFNSTSSALSSISKQVGKKLTETISQSSGTWAGPAMSLINMISGGDENDPGAMSTSETLAMMLGTSLSGKVMPAILDNVTPKLKAELGDKEATKRIGKILENFHSRTPELLRSAVSSGNTGYGGVDSLIRFFDLNSLIDGKANDVSYSVESKLTSAQVFDLQTKRSITDVIPGLLTRIHSEVRRFNGEDEGLLRYDWRTSSFEQQAALDKRLIDQAIEGSNVKAINQRESEVLKSIDPEGKLSNETRAKLTRAISIAAMTNRGISFQNFMDPSSEHYIQEFADFIDKDYGTIIPASYDGSIKSQAQFMAQASEKFLDVDTQLQDTVKRLRGESADPLKILLKQAEQGDISSLRKYPFIKVAADGTYTIDRAAYYDYIKIHGKVIDLEKSPTEQGLSNIEDKINKHQDKQRELVQKSLAKLGFDPQNARESLDNMVSNAMTRAKLMGTNGDIPEDFNVRSNNFPTEYEGIDNTILGRGRAAGARARSSLEARFDAMRNHESIKSKTDAVSVWVKGEASPRLDAISMRLGKYYSASTGKVIKTVQDIKEDVVDAEGNIILTYQQVKDGLFDKFGNAFKTEWTRDNAVNHGNKLINQLKSSVKNFDIKSVLSKGSLKGQVPNVGDIKKRVSTWAEEKKVSEIIGVSALKNHVEQNKKLGDIKETLDKQLEALKPKFAFNDKNQDGGRDHNWKDILQQRRDKKKQIEGNIVTLKEGKEKKQGILGKLLSFLPSIIPAVGGMFAKAFGFAIPSLTGLLGGAIRLAVPAALGSLGLKWLANKWLNRGGDPTMVAPDDPRLDPSSPMYDPNLKVREPGVMDGIAQKYLDANPLTQLAVGGAAAYLGVKGAKWGAKKALSLTGRGAAAAGRWGAGAVLRGAVRGAGAAGAAGSTAALNAALIARAGARGMASGGALGAARGVAGMVATVGGRAGALGLGTAAKFAGKTLLRGVLGPIGWAWLAYDVAKFGYNLYKKHSDDGKKLNRLRMASYGYHHKDEEHVSKLMEIEQMLIPHVAMKEKAAYLKDSISTEEVMRAFNVVREDDQATEAWTMYFFGRFLPVFLTCCTAMNARTKTFNVLEMDDQIKPEEQVKVCDEIIFSREKNNPYDVMISGFSGEKKVEMDKKAVMEAYKLVRSTLAVKAAKKKDKHIKQSDVIDAQTKGQVESETAKFGNDGIMAKLAKGSWAGSMREMMGGGVKSIFGDGFMGRAISGALNGITAPTQIALSLAETLASKIGALFGGNSNTAGGDGSAVSGDGVTMEGAPSKGFTPQMAEAIKWGANQLGINPNYLASVISFETGGTFNTNARNPKSSATGLIQFMDYADGKTDGKYWGMTRNQFGGLSPAEQMKYVVKYFQERKLKAGASLGQVYDAVTGTGYRKGSKSYELNKIWDANKDGYIAPGESVTSGAFKQHMKAFFGNDGSPLNTVAGAPASASNDGAGGAGEAADAVADDGKSSTPKATTKSTKTTTTAIPSTIAKPTSTTKATPRNPLSMSDTVKNVNNAKPTTTNKEDKNKKTAEKITAFNASKSSAGPLGLGGGKLAQQVAASSSASTSKTKSARPPEPTDKSKTTAGKQAAKTDKVKKDNKENPSKLVTPGTGPLKPQADSDKSDANSRAPNLDMTPNIVKPTDNSVPTPMAPLPADSKPVKAAAIARRKAQARSTGACARYVREALQGAGYQFPSQYPSAYMYHTKGAMTLMGMVQIDTKTPWQIGDVIVFNNNGSHPHGHIQIWDGRAWISDFVQSNWKAYGRNCPPFSLWRDKDYLRGAKPGSGWTTPDGANVSGANTNEFQFGVEGGGTNATRRKWTQTRAIRGGDALWGASTPSARDAAKKAAETQADTGAAGGKAVDAKDSTTDKKAEQQVKSQANTAKASATSQAATDVTNAAKETGSTQAKGGSVAAAAARASNKETPTTSAKSTETQLANDTAARSQQAKEDAARRALEKKEREQEAKAQRAREQNLSDASILQQQLKIQTNMLSELKGLRQDLQGFTQMSQAERQSLKDIVNDTKRRAKEEFVPNYEPPLSDVQAPSGIIESVSLLK